MSWRYRKSTPVSSRLSPSRVRSGNRTKIAVVSHDENVDPIGACVGTRGARVANITGELNGEKIDIIKWNEDMAQFVSAALAPADVINATMQADNKSCRVIVPDDQLSLAIGKEGQNARLAAKLTGCKIDIAPESQANKQAEVRQNMVQKKIPMRQCLGCREMFPKRELIRVVRSPEGELSLDFKGKAPGRGAYLCGKPECLKKARKSRAIERALSVEVPESVYDQLEQQMEQEGANGN